MKARGIYVYGVWVMFDDFPSSNGYSSEFYADKWKADNVKVILENIYGVSAVVRRVYIAPPKGGRK